MAKEIGRRFIPSYILIFASTAVMIPYLSIMIRDLGYSPAWVGVLLGIFEGAGIVGPFLFGYWSDKAGNYRFSLLTACGLPVIAVLPLVRWAHPAVSAACLAFLAASLRSSMSLLDAATTIQIGRSGNYGRIRVWGSIGFIIASLCLQWTPVMKPDTAAHIGLWIMIIYALAMVPVLALPGAMLRPPPAARPENAASPEAGAPETGVPETSAPASGGSKAAPLFSAYILGGFAVIFLSRIAMSVVYTYFPLYVREVLRWDILGVLFAIATASEVPIIFISSALVRRFGPLPMLGLSAIGVALRLLIWAFLPFKPFIVVSQMLHSLCYGIFHPAAVYFIAGIFPAQKRGTGMSIYMAVGIGLPALIGNMAGGAIAENWGYPSLFALYAAVSGLAVLLCAAMLKGSSLPRAEAQGLGL